MASRLIDAVHEIEDPKLRAQALAALRMDPRLMRGFVAATDDKGNVGWVPWQKASAHGPTGQSKLVDRTITRNIPEMKNDPLIKRDERERVESLARRLWATIGDNPQMAPLILKEMQEEYWKAGRPVSYEDMRVAAIELLKKAAEEAQKKGTK